MTTFWKGLALAICGAVAAAAAQAQDHHPAPLMVYGPGGPAPALKELAALFERDTGQAVTVTAGPTPNWSDAAASDADIIYSGSENMMTAFERLFDGMIDTATIEPLYLRPSTILVRPGNPRGITGIRDLIKPGMAIMVVGGAGQVGMWEDVAGRTGDLTLLAGIRSNIVENAVNSGKALGAWKDRPEIDAWLIWTHWEVANDDLADQVPVEADLQVWRAMDMGLTHKGAGTDRADDFMAFVKSDTGAEVFARWGWSTGR